MASIVKRKNRYSVVYTYKDDDGTQHQKWETFDTNADAKKRKTQIEFEQQTAGERHRGGAKHCRRRHHLYHSILSEYYLRALTDGSYGGRILSAPTRALL